MTEPRTFVEQLDDAETGEEFGAVLSNLFDALAPKVVTDE